MVRHVASWKLLGCAVFTSVLLGASRADADSDSYPEDRVCADVQRMVGISSQGRGILDALAKVFGGAQDRKQAFAVAKQFEDVGRFADLVLGGSEPRLLEIQILDVTNVANRFSICDPPRWRFGDWGQRDALARHLWDRAKSLQPHDPAGATHLGKAAVALCAQDRFDSSPLGLFLRDPQVSVLAGADPKLVKAMLDEIIPSQEAGNASFHRRAAIAEPLNRCIELDQAKQSYAHDAALVISGFRENWPGVASRDEAWRLANLLWRFICLSRANHDDNSIQEVASLVQQFAPGTPDKYSKRWLQEVLTISGERPKNSGVQIIRDPNQMKPGKGP